jgi:hypothetical protein
MAKAGSDIEQGSGGHTPTPWFATENAYGCAFVHGGPELESFGTKYRALICGGNSHDTLTTANAAFIVKAVNSHDRLKAALAEVLSYREGRAPYDFHRLPADERGNAAFDAWQEVEAKARAAIASAEAGNGR